MSCMNSATAGQCEPRHLLPVSSNPASRIVTGPLRQLVHLALTWIERGRQRNDLAELDAHLLRDIGVSSEEARTETKKPFWRQ